MKDEKMGLPFSITFPFFLLFSYQITTRAEEKQNMDAMTSIVKQDLAAVVLIGGKSKRMGTPKACIEVAGEKLALRTARLLPVYR
jgi:hypothetical protein